VRVYAYPDAASLQEALLFSRGSIGGITFPEYRIVAISASPGRLDAGSRVLTHELAHVLVHQATFGCFSMVPVWLNEGIATYIEGRRLGPTHQTVLAEALEQERLFSIRSISRGFPHSGAEVSLAYAQGASLVQFLVERYGAQAMRELLAAIQEGLSQDEALLRVYRFDTEGLEKRWRAYLQGQELERPGPQFRLLGCALGRSQGFARGSGSTSLLPTSALPLLPLLGSLMAYRWRRRS
ncbi:MAG: peptidase MA family metallohydrolase, partial [Dehalococcoidia bacterium]